MSASNLTELFGLHHRREWDQQQLEAIKRCTDVNERLVPVTGRAGTGKTSIIEEVHKRLTDAGYSVNVSAPTGKAAKRIKEATGIMAETNHRMLGYGMPIENKVEHVDGRTETVKLSTGPRFTNKTPLPFDVLLCDEYAMVTNQVHREIIAAMKHGAMVRMFGDVNQLRPIEEERALRDAPSQFEVMLKRFKGVTLERQHRAGEGSGIVESAGAILQGKLPKQYDDFRVIMSQTPVTALQRLVEQKKADGIDFSLPDHQVITCMNQSWVGTLKLNAILQSMFWSRDHRPLDLPRWRQDRDNPPVRVQIGTKVVYSANSYDLGNGQMALNGEVGTVVEIDHDYGSIDIDFGDRVVSLPPLVIQDTPRGYVEFDPRCNVNLAYALTTHKMQGSEAGHVIYVMNKSTVYGVSRRNLYTGVTRARNNCTVITDQTALTKALRYPG